MRKEKKPIDKSRSEKDVRNFFDSFWSWNPTSSYHNIFNDFENHFRDIEKRMQRFQKGFITGQMDGIDPKTTKIYGWSYSMGPDGKPHFKEFGNMPHLPSNKQQLIQGNRDPPIDIQEGEKEIYVTIELPGVDKKDINLELTKETLSITIQKNETNYQKEIKLPKEINDNKSEAAYNNGILSITLQKIKTKQKGKKIDIT